MTWIETRDGDLDAFQIFMRHYTARPNRKRRRFVGPGERIVLITPEKDALFVWRKFYNQDGQTGINCAVFRNESPRLSSELILEAEEFARAKWPNERLYTYVNPKAVASKNPGFCFKKAGWKLCGVTKTRGYLILEKTL